jgi:hypothetical protein
MPDENRTARLEPRSAEERQAASLLVRCWLEPNESADEAPVLRGYVRNLKTGEERFIKDLDSVGQQILRQLAPADEKTEALPVAQYAAKRMSS